MKTEDSGEPPDAELLGAGLFRLTGFTVEPLTVVQLLRLHELLQTVVNAADRLLPVPCLPHRAAPGRGNVYGKVQERIISFA